MPPRAEYIRTVMLELERLHSHLLWVGLACHIVGFDTLFMQSFRIREPIMWIAEKISGNRKTYAICLIGGVRRDISPLLKGELRAVLDKLESEWQPGGQRRVATTVTFRSVLAAGVADKFLVKQCRPGWACRAISRSRYRLSSRSSLCRLRPGRI